MLSSGFDRPPKGGVVVAAGYVQARRIPLSSLKNCYTDIFVGLALGCHEGECAESEGRLENSRRNEREDRPDTSYLTSHHVPT
jgi:hypothetical protein